MAWRIEFDPRAEKELRRLERQAQVRLVRFLRQRVAPLNDPRIIGQALTAPELGRFWKYRVADYRIICHIDDDAVTVLVVRVGHRRAIYR